LNQDLEREVLFHLQSAWSSINYQLFNEELNQPAIKLSESKTFLGQWDGLRRVISLQRDFIVASPWLDVIEVLKHEVAHQYVDEVCDVHDETAHGPTFKSVCSERGILSSASAQVEQTPQVTRLLNRINKLLALAQSDNIHEAERAAERARSLLARHHISLGSQELEDAFKSMSFCQLGRPKYRHYQYEYALINMLSDHFFVKCIWVSGLCIKTGKTGKVVEVCGREEDLEIASYVYDFVLNHLDLVWRQYRKEHSVKGLRKRLSFSLGLVRGFASKLQKNETHTSEERSLIKASQSQAQAFLERRYAHMRTKHVGGWSPSGDYQSGFEEGRSLNLRRGVESTPASVHQPHRLTRT
jgi:hypothetical protein